MEKSFARFVESVIRWKKNKIDEFFKARLWLTLYYALTAIFILGISSILLYKTILSNLAQSIREGVADPRLATVIIDKAAEILLNQFLTINIILILLILILGFLLTHKTLEPIQTNMQKQKRFIADASHELRTPIAVIISGLEVNLNNKKLDITQARQTLENTLEEMREFSTLSNNLLDISKYNSSKQVGYENIRISELLTSTIEKIHHLAQAKNIHIETSIVEAALVKGNKIELERVFNNVLDNAIKYTHPGGTIRVSDIITPHNYTITIADTGSGIAKDVLDRIFDPFFRADSGRSAGGAGLGLTISKNIIENHNGIIEIKSLLHKGTEVYITLPLSS